MEPTTIFLAAVAFVAASHLATSAAKALRKNRKATYQAASRTRSDWYCFFSRSALYGKDKEVQSSRHNYQNKHASQGPRPTQHARPRIYK